ncbi:fatty acid desaturase [Pseudanabaena mucicola]|uniref:Fatty acid desaturase n=1 Tax=Pseudanabaena mucicola FACHB-723 TaxID=2692860 RepID=A0ABR8A308_9CYAN|nr:fatty acid desaturase [Pseudanabaena mucicola]MBD2190125.1 fatty acid desaturase [Pseudanabaena mucicola FACHB-723]
MNLTSENSDPSVHPVFDDSKIGMTGVEIALLVIIIWALGFYFLVNSVSVKQTSLGWVGVMILWQTFICTGLFITAHDAMHGAILPKHHQINHFIGSLALLLYGFFSYDEISKKHLQHHHAPASEADPDFHDGTHKNAIAWYICFMQRYWSWWRLAVLLTAYASMHSFLNIAYANLILFSAVPTILSSIQVFYFGTFLPHREPIGGYQNTSRAQSIYRPLLWSFLTCYHFGYHQEHHLQPNTPWWKLPSLQFIS